jgi:uncharacterized protein YaaN involved in tellurite resistance
MTTTPQALFADSTEPVTPTQAPQVDPALAQRFAAAQANAMLAGTPQAGAVQTVEATAQPVAPPTVAVAAVTKAQVDAVDQRGTDKMAAVSQGILEATKSSDAGEMGELLNNLVVTAKGLDPNAVPSGFFGKIFHKAELSKERVLAHYQSVKTRMDALAGQVDQRAQREMVRIADLERMEDANMDVMREKTQALKSLQEMAAQAQAHLTQVDARIQALGAQADFSMTRERTDAQSMADYTADRVDNCQRLILLAKQRAPQLRIMIENARSLVQRFADIKVSVIPAWSDRLALYITQMDQKGAAALANSIFEASDEALRKQADALRQSSAEVAELKRHTVASTDALAYVNEQLIGTLDDLNKAAEDERRARTEAQAKLQELETQLVHRLLKPQEGGVLAPKA